jgi:hypothetical protein
VVGKLDSARGALWGHPQIRFDTHQVSQRSLAPFFHQQVSLTKVNEAGVANVGLDALFLENLQHAQVRRTSHRPATQYQADPSGTL